MSSNLRVNNILPSVGTNVAIGTAGGSITLTGGVTGSSIINTGVTTVAAGSVSAPSISPTGDSNTGIFFPSADTVAIAEGGVEALRVDSNGRVGVNTTNPDTTLEVFNGTLKVASTDALNRSLTIDPGSNATYESRIDASHSLVFRSYVAAGAGVKTCTFNTNGDLDLTEGRNLIFASGRGIDFSATANSSGTMTSELLNDYEEGTWTPTYQGTTGSAGSIAYATRTGRYTKIGRTVHATCEIILSNKGSWTGAVVITNLPFTNSGGSEITMGSSILGFVDFTAGQLYTNTRGTGANDGSFYIDITSDNLDRVVLNTTAVANNSSFFCNLIYTSSS